MKRIIIGTAGHIDHGKTALVRALTGVDTDRLDQEKDRGITIELGFTHLELPSGVDAGIIDVPGHEKFVRTMIAGAWGMDLVLLVIAADEGVMPQTTEHLDICQLLGVRSGIVVINKADLVDEEMAELAAEEARDALAGTFLEGAPVVVCSAVTGQGIDALRETIEGVAGIQERSAAGAFRMPIDRVFTMRGFGTIVTGTAADGSAHVGTSVEVWPSNRKARIRGLQVHGESVETARAGQRVAVNLQGVDKDEISRGDVLSAPGALAPTYMLDVEYVHLKGAPKRFKPKRIRFLSGTAEVTGTIHFLGDDDFATPGASCFAQLRLDAPVAVRAGDRFVLRTYSPMLTVGGGQVLDPLPHKHKKKETGLDERLALHASGDIQGAVAALVASEGLLGLSQERLALRLRPAVSAKLDETLEALIRGRKLARIATPAPRLLSRRAFDQIAAAVESHLKAFHRENPAQAGVRKGALVSAVCEKVKLGGPDAASVADGVIGALEADEKVAVEADEVRLSSHLPRIEGELAEQTEQVSQAFLEGGLTPPAPKQVSEKLGLPDTRVREIIGLLVRSGDLVRTKEDLYFHQQPLESIQSQLVGYLQEHGKITTLEFKAMAGISRKYMIPLLEHFDAARVTMRVGDERVLRGK